MRDNRSCPDLPRFGDIYLLALFPSIKCDFIPHHFIARLGKVHFLIRSNEVTIKCHFIVSIKWHETGCQASFHLLNLPQYL